jgi:ankyrin repeat protein
MACKTSNDEAIRQLIEKHNYDCNILLKNKSAIFELLSNSSALDYNILVFMLKNAIVDVNSGAMLPINQAVERGNFAITKLLIDLGKPNFYK